jgi:hypothetical protein
VRRKPSRGGGVNISVGYINGRNDNGAMLGKDMGRFAPNRRATEKMTLPKLLLANSPSTKAIKGIWGLSPSESGYSTKSGRLHRLDGVAKVLCLHRGTAVEEWCEDGQRHRPECRLS